MKRLKTIDQVFDVLDGTTGVAKIAKAKRKQAWWWKAHTGRFPANTYVPIKRELNARGYDAPDDLWPMKT